MRRRLLAGLLAALMTALTGCAADAEAADVWMYAVSAGKADAILVGAGDSACLIDAGYARSRGKILAAMERMGVERLDAVFVTHTDDDHTDGLEWLAESDIEVGAWYASAMYTGVKEKKHPAVKAAAIRGEQVRWLQAGDSVPLGGARLDVLAPISLYNDKDDNNSLVMMLRSDAGSILLVGDMEFPEEAELVASGVSLDCDVLKVANHADDDTTGEAFVRAASPKVAVISTSTEEKPETPDPRAVALLQAAGAEVAVTQECTGGILVRLDGGVPTVERVSLPEPDIQVSIARVIPGEDLIVLNNGGAAASLAGWYLCSERGGEMMVLPEGAAIPSGGSLTIGTNSSEGDFDLLWNDKNVIHSGKRDVISLYAPNGLLVSEMDNGY